jgi:hypothetical protein
MLDTEQTTHTKHHSIYVLYYIQFMKHTKINSSQQKLNQKSVQRNKKYQNKKASSIKNVTFIHTD